MNTFGAADHKARRRARELLVQALYQHQLSGHDAVELTAQFRQRDGYAAADGAYFEAVLPAVIAAQHELNAWIARFARRGEDQLDPVGRAVLWVGLHELGQRRDVPDKVVINEAVELAKRFGATDSHRFVNAVLDRARTALRDGVPG